MLNISHSMNLWWGLGICICVAAVAHINREVLYDAGMKQWERYVQSLGDVHGRVFRGQSIETFAQRMLALALVAVMVGLLFSNIVVGLTLGALVLLLGRRYLNHLLAKRISRFEEQIPELCRSLSNSLSAGLVLPQAFEVAVRYLPPPASEELNNCLKEFTLGVSLESSLQRLSHRLKSESFAGILSALIIARNAGGDIKRVLEETAESLQTIRRLEQKFQTATAQAQLQVKVMAVLGPAFMGLLFLFSPSTIMILFVDPIGNIVLAVIVLLEMAGFYIARKILIQ